jgi:hypothetical protein
VGALDGLAEDVPGLVNLKGSLVEECRQLGILFCQCDIRMQLLQKAQALAVDLLQRRVAWYVKDLVGIEIRRHLPTAIASQWIWR